jgi:hypothetical protein
VPELNASVILPPSMHGFDPQMPFDSCNRINNYSCHDASPPFVPFVASGRAVSRGSCGKLTDSSMLS